MNLKKSNAQIKRNAKMGQVEFLGYPEFSELHESEP